MLYFFKDKIRNKMKDKHFYFSIIFSMFIGVAINKTFNIVEENFTMMFIGAFIGTILIDIYKTKENKLEKDVK